VTRPDGSTLACLHPNPQLARARWRLLDGPWEFAFDDAGRYQYPGEIPFDRRIRVPFPPESQASGIGEPGFHYAVWYRLRLTLAPGERGERLLLHFGAVDYAAQVWCNEHRVAEHYGGHTPFFADITETLGQTDDVVVVVRAWDDPHDLAKPRGKQDWLEQPHEIWYPRTTGIWQSVWLEPVPVLRIAHLRWTPHVENWEIALEVNLQGPIPTD